MRRLRVLRVLLPVTLFVFLVLVVLQLRPRSSPHSPPAVGGQDAVQSGTDIEVREFEGQRPVLDFEADLVEEGGEGEIHIENIERFAVYRPEREPLIISADVGDVAGAVGERLMMFESEVVIRDPDHGLVAVLPTLLVDEAAGEARSKDGVQFETPVHRGRAATLIYGLEGQPTVLSEFELENDEGLELVARKAVLLDGLDDVELEGDVHAVRAQGEFVDAGRLRVIRGPTDRLRQIIAWDDVRGAIRLGSGSLLQVSADEAGLLWDLQGQPDRMTLRGDAELGEDNRSLAAQIVHAVHDARNEEWAVFAEDAVHLQGLVGLAPAWLRSEQLEARLSEEFALLRAEATGEVRFDGPATRAEADAANLRQVPRGTEIELLAPEGGKARLARGRTRIAAKRIVTDPGGERLDAEREVEATLLPLSAGADGSNVPGLFRAEEAVHFVAERLEAQDAGSILVFSGSVRGWQGGQNLSAEGVSVRQSDSALSANGNVNTRFPREDAGDSTAEASYVQISSDRLEYDDGLRRATYDGSVRIRLAEGWLEAARVELDLHTDAHGIREIRAFDDVRMEFRDPAEPERPQIVAGRADRLRYTPADETVWLYGEQQPASVRRIGGGEGTTTGRVLRYRLDSGTLDVDSGEQAPAQIRTSDG